MLLNERCSQHARVETADAPCPVRTARATRPDEEQAAAFPERDSSGSQPGRCRVGNTSGSLTGQCCFVGMRKPDAHGAGSCCGTNSLVSDVGGAALASRAKQNFARGPAGQHASDKPRRRDGAAPVPLRRNSRDWAIAVAHTADGDWHPVECGVIDKSVGRRGYGVGPWPALAFAHNQPPVDAAAGRLLCTARRRRAHDRVGDLGLVLRRQSRPWSAHASWPRSPRPHLGSAAMSVTPEPARSQQLARSRQRSQPRA